MTDFNDIYGILFKYFSRSKKVMWTISFTLLGLVLSVSVGAINVVRDTSISYCKSAPLPIDLNLVVGTALPANAGTWYSRETNQPVSNIFLPSAKDEVTRFYFVMESVRDLCGLVEDDRYNVSIFANDVPTPEGDELQFFCDTADYTIEDLNAEGKNIEWYDSFEGGNRLSLATPVFDGETYYATQRLEGCGESTERLGVTVVFEQMPQLTHRFVDASAGAVALGDLSITDVNATEGTITYHALTPEGTLGDELPGDTVFTENCVICVVKRTENGACEATLDVPINFAAECGFTVDAEISSVLCYGGNDGFIDLNVVADDSAATFTYEWSHGATTARVDGLSAGIYQVKVIPNNGVCTPQELSYTITEPDLLKILMEGIRGETTARAEDGQATAIISGGTPEYAYHWIYLDRGDTIESGAMQPGEISLEGLEGGKYQVHIVDKNGCEISGDVFTIDELLFIPNAFSPEDDNGYNDVFEILGLDDYPDAKLEVFNRWNTLVYTKDSYGNETRWGGVDAWWDGSANRGPVVGDELLPAGHYVFVLQLEPDNPKVYKGVIFLNR